MSWPIGVWGDVESLCFSGCERVGERTGVGSVGVK